MIITDLNEIFEFYILSTQDVFDLHFSFRVSLAQTYT